MSKKNFLAIGAALLFFGCSDVTAPLDEAAMNASRLGSLGGATNTITNSLVGTINKVTASLLPKNTLVHSTLAPPLMSYDTSFVAIQGEVATIDLHYVNPITGGPGETFLYLEIPEDAQLLHDDGSAAAPGEAIVITVHVDEVSFFVQLGPHGSTFPGNRGTRLSINLTYALNAPINLGTPTIWYQPKVGEPWKDEGTSIHRQGNWIYVELTHFSNYAVAW